MTPCAGVGEERGRHLEIQRAREFLFGAREILGGSFRSGWEEAQEALFPLRLPERSRAPPETHTTPALDESSRCSCPSSPNRQPWPAHAPPPDRRPQKHDP